MIAPIIDQATATFAVDLVFHRGEKFGTDAVGLGEDFVAVWGVEVERDCAGAPLAVSFGQFENGIADLEFGVTDEAGFVFVLGESFWGEGRLHEGEEASGISDAEAGIHVLKESGSITGTSVVRGNVPMIADGILDAPFAIAVFHLARRVERLRTGVEGGVVDGVDIADIVVETGKERLLLGAANIAHFKHGVAEFDGGVEDAPIGILGANGFLGVEGGFEEIEEARNPVNDEIGSDAAVARGYW
jgi:hypothetical protein